jgi:hypothetical protein
MWFVSWVYHEHESPTCKNPRYAALSRAPKYFQDVFATTCMGNTTFLWGHYVIV